MDNNNDKNDNNNNGNNKTLIKNSSEFKIYPLFDELVDSLYTPELNTLIEKNCTSILDKKTFIMFIIMYFMTFLHLKPSKENMKIFLTDMLKNPQKRSKCIELFMSFENSVKQITEY